MTYDMRREQDSLNPCTHANIMVLSPEDDPSAHPYWYAHIIRIYHTLVHHESSPDPICLDLLWVCWYGLDPDHRQQFSWKRRRLPHIGFIEDGTDPESPAFGFIHPSQVICGVHIIPSFNDGLTGNLLEPSLTHLPDEGNLDFKFYYVN